MSTKLLKFVGSSLEDLRGFPEYVAKLTDAIYVLHAFQKKGPKTNKNDIELARKRFRQIGSAI